MFEGVSIRDLELMYLPNTEEGALPTLDTQYEIYLEANRTREHYKEYFDHLVSPLEREYASPHYIDALEDIKELLFNVELDLALIYNVVIRRNLENPKRENNVTYKHAVQNYCEYIEKHNVLHEIAYGYSRDPEDLLYRVKALNNN